VRLVRSLIALGVVAAALTSCSGEDGPPPAGTAVAAEPPGASAAPSSSTATSPPTATSAPPTVEPGASSEVLVAPRLPAAATVPDAAGAEAFVRYWYELVNHAYATGDGEALLAVSHADCIGCLGTVENIRTATDTGGAWRGMHFAPEQFEVSEPDGDGISLATALLVASPDATVLEADGDVVGVSGLGIESVWFYARWTGDHWQASAIALPDRPQ
jgi:hypothetical protein